MKQSIRQRNFKILIILALVFTTACASVLPTPQSEPTPTPILIVSTPTIQQAAASPTNSMTYLSPTRAETTEELNFAPDPGNRNISEVNMINVTIGDTILSASLVENSSVDALKAALSEGPITIDMRDYGSMEKVGSLGMDLPRNDQQITTEAGDIILFQGSMLVIYYAPNSWNFTRLGKINDISAEELRNLLGDGSVTVTLSLP